MSTDFGKGNYDSSKKKNGLKSAGDLGPEGETKKKTRSQLRMSSESSAAPGSEGGKKYLYQFSSGTTSKSGSNGSVSKKFTPPSTPQKRKWPWIAAISAVLVIAVVIGVIRALPGPDDGGGDDPLLMELQTLAEALYEEQVSADEYYNANSSVLGVADVSKSSDLLTEAQAISLLQERGFTQYPVTFTYSPNGDFFDETEAVVTSKDRHPMYTTTYVSSAGELWMIYIVNGDVFADPVSIVLELGLSVPVLVSESNTLTSYDNSTNTFYTTVPHETEVKVKVVGRIDAAALDNLTSEEVAAS